MCRRAKASSRFAKVDSAGAARYGRNGAMDRSKLDDAFESGVNALKKLRSAKRWPARTINSLTRQATEVVWSR